MAYMALVGIFGFAQDRFVLLLETVLGRDEDRQPAVNGGKRM